MKIDYISKLGILILILWGVCYSHTGFAQSKAMFPIQGKVLDENNLEIIGATVKVASRSTGTVTDTEGVFRLNVSAGEMLEISYVGYKTKSIKVTSSGQKLVIMLQEDAVTLSDVVVVGYGTTRKEKLTGAVSTVSVDDLKNRPITDPSLALQGKVTGVQVTQNSGQPGADAATVTIRGIGTLNDSSPLVIINGFESSFDKVDPKDIETMTVLKDAASAAIYGNKAANGVILITTKKGRSGQLSIEYNGYLATQKVTRYPSLLGSVDYLELYNEALENSGMQRLFTEEYINNFRTKEDPASYPDRNWADFYFKPALHHNHYLKMTGGTDKLAYNLSVGYTDQQGILSGTEYKKYNFRANTNSSFFNDKLKISTNIAGHLGRQKDLISGTGATLSRIVQMRPTVNAKMEGYGWTDWFYDDAIKEAGGGITNKNNNFNGNFNVQLQLTKQLKLEGAVSYDTNQEFGEEFAPNVTLYTVETGANGEQTIGKNNSRESLIRKSTYTHGSLSSYATASFWANAKDHHFKFLAGAQQARWESNYYRTERKRLTANLPALSVGNPATQKNYDWANEITSLSLFGRFNYDYNDKYLFEANVRYDGSSKFAVGNKWGLFPSFSAGWRISEEKFMKPLAWVDELKLRVSWGQLGNEKIWNPYAGIDILSVGENNYIWNNQNTTGAALAYISNKDLTWETTTQQNLGVDMQLFKGFTFSGDFYIKNTKNILMQLPVSDTFGYMEIPWKNAGAMRNTGCEFSASYYRDLTSGLGFNVGGNISFNRNKITDLKGQSPILNNTTGILLQEGLPINTLYGYEIEGIYQSDDEIHKHLVTFDRLGNPVNSYSGLVAAPGDIRFKDQNNDGIIDIDHDRVALGDPSPDFFYSLTGGLKYKGFDLTVFLQGVYGGEGWSSGELVSPFFNGYNTAGWMIDRWTPERPNNTYQRVYIDSQRSSIKSAYYVEDMSYLRLKNLELGYTLPTTFLKKIYISGARIYISGQNLFTITSYKGFDPERAGVQPTNIYAYPLVKTFTTGINVTF